MKRVKMKNKRNFSFVSAFWILLIFSTTIFAETGAANDDSGSLIKVMFAVTAFLIAFVLWLVLVYAESNDAKGERIITPLSKFIHAMTQSASLQEEEDILLDHDFDGIKELDNKIPPWWTALFYGGIIFAFVYMIDYHVIGDGNVQISEYEQEIHAAECGHNNKDRPSVRHWFPAHLHRQRESPDPPKRPPVS